MLRELLEGGERSRTHRLAVRKEGVVFVVIVDGGDDYDDYDDDDDTAMAARRSAVGTRRVISPQLRSRAHVIVACGAGSRPSEELF